MRAARERDGRLLGRRRRDATGARGPIGPTGAQGPQGVDGPQGQPGVAVAYAHVVPQQDGTLVLDPSRTKGVTVTRADVGVYCVTVADTIHSVVATVDAISGGPGAWTTAAAAAPQDTTGDPCGGTETGSVKVFDKTGAPADDAFYLIVN